MLTIKMLSAWLFSMSLLRPSISDPIPIPAPAADGYRPSRGNWSTPTATTATTTACPNISTTLRLRNPLGFQTLTVFTPAPCPTSTVTAFESGCTEQFIPACPHAQCMLLSTTTEGCPGGCCPKKAPTTTTTLPCTGTCRVGCGIVLTTQTVGCKSRG